MKGNINNSKGVTLIELVITLAILSIVLLGIYGFFRVGSNSFMIGSRQYRSQSDVRLAIEAISKEIRYATEVKLLSTIPSSIGIDDKYNYFYVKDGSLVHSLYNNGAVRNIHSYGQGIQDASDFNTEQVGEFQSIDFHLLGQDGNQNFDLHADLSMPNINLNENYIPDTIGAVAVKYYKNTDLDYIPPEDEGEEGEEDPESYYVTVTIEFPTNNYKMYFDGVEKIVSNKKVIVSNVLGGLSGTNHTLSFYYKQGSTYKYDRDEPITAYKADITYKYAGP